MHNSIKTHIQKLCIWIMKIILFSIVVHLLMLAMLLIGKINGSHYNDAISFKNRLLILLTQVVVFFSVKLIVRKMKK